MDCSICKIGKLKKDGDYLSCTVCGNMSRGLNSLNLAFEITEEWKKWTPMNRRNFFFSLPDFIYKELKDNPLISEDLNNMIPSLWKMLSLTSAKNGSRTGLYISPEFQKKI